MENDWLFVVALFFCFPFLFGVMGAWVIFIFKIFVFPLWNWLLGE